jgi:hypothetical protein
MLLLKGSAGMSSTTSSPRVKLIGWLIVIAGAFMVVAGGVTWGVVSSQLKDANITVAAVTPENPGRLAGKPVAGPFTAYAQAAAINHHALDGAGGRTYAQLGDDAKALKAKLAASGTTKEDIAKDPGVLALADTRDTAMNGSFLRASLFTSVVAFGVAALVIGLGVLFALLGFALLQIASTKVTTSAAKQSEPSGSTA